MPDEAFVMCVRAIFIHEGVPVQLVLHGGAYAPGGGGVQGGLGLCGAVTGAWV